MPSSADLVIYNCGQLVTCRGPRRPRLGREMRDVGVIAHGALLSVDGVVKRIGTTKEILRQREVRHALLVDAGGRVLFPGFVDAHTHALFAGIRLNEYEDRIRGSTYEDIARKGGGIQTSARQIRKATLRSLAERLQRMGRLFLEHGTTTVEVKSGYGLDPTQELKILQAIKRSRTRDIMEWIPTLLVHAVPEQWPGGRGAYIKCVLDELVPAVGRRRLAEFFDVFCDRGYFTVPEARRMMTAAGRAGFKLKVHADQLARTGAARMAASLGACTVDHLDRINQIDVGYLAKTGTLSMLLPGSVLHLNSGTYPPARRLIDGGVPIALATNCNPGSSPTLNMQMIMSLACSQMRMSPAEALTAATINGAYGVGRGDRVGSLEVGKQADMTLMDVEDFREVAYFFGMNHAMTVIKRGRIVYSKEAVR